MRYFNRQSSDPTMHFNYLYDLVSNSGITLETNIRFGKVCIFPEFRPCSYILSMKTMGNECYLMRE